MIIYLFVLAVMLAALSACSFHVGGTGSVTYRECIGEYCSEGEVEVPDSQLMIGGVVRCTDVAADEAIDRTHAHFNGQFQMNAPDQDFRAHLVVNYEASAYAGEEYGVWTCADYRQMSSTINQFHFIGQFTEQPAGASGTAQVVIVPGEDAYQVQLSLNPGDYHNWMWAGYIDLGDFGLIPR
jgi:hypothetical protein